LPIRLGVHVTLENTQEGAAGFFYAKSKMACVNDVGSNCNQPDFSCNTINATKYNTTRFEISKNGIKYFINNSLQSTITKCNPSDVLMKVHLSCSSKDGKNHPCNYDYVRLTKKNP